MASIARSAKLCVYLSEKLRHVVGDLEAWHERAFRMSVIVERNEVDFFKKKEASGSGRIRIATAS